MAITFDHHALDGYFRKFGEIESIEMVKGEKLEAFITFQRDICAFAAISYHENQGFKKIKYEYIVQPAHTSKQPQQQNSLVQSIILNEEYVPPRCASEILIDDCWEKIFQYLDVYSLRNLRKICKKFGGENGAENGLVIERGYKSIKSFDFNIKNGGTSLTQMQRELKYIGKHINTLRFDCNHNIFEDIHQFLELLGRGVGNQIRHAVFKRMILKKRDIAAIKPILRNLTSLKFYDVTCKSDIYFKAICPNLNRLRLESNIKLLDKGWPKLQTLSFDSWTLDPNEFREFLKQSPQIANLNLFSLSGELESAVQHLKIILKLPIESRFDKKGISVNAIQPLISLRKLKIEVDGKQCEEDIEYIVDIFDCLSQFKTLRELKFVQFQYTFHTKEFQQPIITLAQELPYLEKMSLIGIFLMESTVLKIICNARNLKEIHIHNVGIYISNELVFEIVGALENRSQHVIEPLKLFVDKNTVVDSENIQELRVKKYLSVNEYCKHTL